MLTETKKLSIIQYVLAEKNEQLLDKIEKMFYPSVTVTASKPKSLRDLAGRITQQEAEEWEKIVEETSEKIFEDDWK